MKKIYSLVALAALTVGSSVAAPVAVKKDKMPQKLDQAVEVEMTQTESSAKKATRALSSIEDVYGIYNCSGYSGLQSNADELVTYSMTLAPSKKGGNYVTIKNFPFEDTDDMEATIDLAAGTISIAPYQDAWFNENYPNNYVEFITNVYKDKNGNLVNMQPAVGTFDEKGNIIWPEDQLLGFGLNSKEGYFILTYDNYMKKIQFFSYKEEEWKDGGKCTFQDGWINTLVEGSQYVVAPQQVEYKESKTTPNVFLLMNPYKGSAWAELNATPNATGYLLVDASYPDCVCVMPFVPSGCSGEIAELDGTLYLFNTEGVDLDDDFTQEDQIEYNQQLADENDEELRQYLSYWDTESGKMTIFNAYFGTEDNPLAFYGWVDKDKESIPIYSYITISPAGVHDVMVDSNAPVKYYNLQGVEVKNPAAGELVIKKQGGKVVKMIAD